jgi:integrase/recombinase XerD
LPSGEILLPLGHPQNASGGNCRQHLGWQDLGWQVGPVATPALDGRPDVASFKLKHVDLAQELVFQDAREVNTKFSKTFTTWFFPVATRCRL